MKKDIIEILQQHKLGNIPEEQALSELCVLFGVSKLFYCVTEKETGKPTECEEQCNYCYNK